MTTVISHAKKRELALALVDEFGTLLPALIKWVRSSVQEGDITYPRMRLLYVLHCYGPQIMSGLSEQLGVSPRNITTLVDALERDGMVKRVAHPTDRRAIFIELTAQGSENIAAVYEAHRNVASTLFEELSQSDQQDLIRLLGSIRGVLLQKGIAVEQPGKPVPPKCTADLCLE